MKKNILSTSQLPQSPRSSRPFPIYKTTSTSLFNNIFVFNFNHPNSNIPSSPSFLQKNEQARRLELQVMPAPELPKKRLLPPMREPRPGDRGDYGSFMGRGSSPFSFSSGPDVRPGDWYCTFGSCGAHNFASRSSCFKCGALKDESSGGFDGDHMHRARGFGIGSGSGGGSRSGWKSGDWICSRSGCNVHNFASRTECYRCSAPREPGSGPSY